MADDLDPAAVEQPTAAQVLAAHNPLWSGGGQAECSCGRFVSRRAMPQHQADMLAAAGLLMTPEAVGAVVNSIGYVADIPLLAEHDAKVAARALREAAALRRGPDQYGVESVPAQWIEDMADRIERQEKGD